jgi:hypothetical protein
MSNRLTFGLIVSMLALQALALWWMGHVVICKCGYVALWYGDVFASGNSQHLTDWYSFGHINHGVLFYGLFWLIARKRSVNWRMTATVLTGLVWEVGENTDLVINRFREVTMSLDYYGDSVINSVSDSIFMLIGFQLARYLPVWASVLIVIGSEVFTTYMVRDGLTLDTLMLLYPIKAIKDWQMQNWVQH